MFLQYELVQSKLGKFKNTQLDVLYFGNSAHAGQTNQRSKQLISVDQNQIYRIHKIKGIKLMSEKDFILEDSDFPSGADPAAIKDLKKATLRQLRDVQVVQDYVFCSLLQSSRLASLDPQTL